MPKGWKLQEETEREKGELETAPPLLWLKQACLGRRVEVQVAQIVVHFAHLCFGVGLGCFV